MPTANRLRHSAEFASVIRHGDRARRGHLVVYILADAQPGAPRAGLVVGRTVGGSVVRHRVSRRLRALLQERMERLPAGSATVVRALSGAEADSSADFGADLDAALARLLGTRPARRPDRTAVPVL